VAAAEAAFQRFEVWSAGLKMSALFDLTGRVAVVTGGNGGIGRGIALGLAEAGAAVAVFGRNDEKNQRVLSELKAIGVPSVAVRLDVADRAALEPALNRVESELGGIGILVNNAGIVVERWCVARNT
jgi:2-deoxy-D-gluconate 3-dehydrogenase